MKLMKKGVVLVLLFSIILIQICIARDIAISEQIPITQQVTSAIESAQNIVTYFYAGNNLVATKDLNGIKYIQNDRLGTNRVTTDSSANKVGETKTLPFGEEILNTNDGKFTFTGKELDSKLYYFGSRYYDASSGRFTSVDPIKDNHAYNYVNDNPMNYVDPNAQDPVPAANINWRWDHPSTGSHVYRYGIRFSVWDEEMGQYVGNSIDLPAPYVGDPNLDPNDPQTGEYTDPLYYRVTMTNLQANMYFGICVYGVGQNGGTGPLSLMSAPYLTVPVGTKSADSDNGVLYLPVKSYSENPDGSYGNPKIDNERFIYLMTGGASDRTGDRTDKNNPKAFPNPASTSITINNLGPNVKVVNAYDARGYLIKSLQANDRGEITWDLTDNQGTRVSSGLYFLHIPGQNTARITVVR